VTVGGDSAGANLAAVVSQLTVSGGMPAPVAQLLIYPATDMTSRRRSHELFGDTFILTKADCEAFYRCYVPSGVDRADPRVSPLRARDLSNLPPALVVLAGFDVLRDEGAEYARALAAAGTRVTVQRVPDLGHAFIHLTGIVPAARHAMLNMAREWSNLLQGARAC
jgi:acetyl esterase